MWPTGHLVTSWRSGAKVATEPGAPGGTRTPDPRIRSPNPYFPLTCGNVYLGCSEARFGCLQLSVVVRKSPWEWGRCVLRSRVLARKSARTRPAVPVMEVGPPGSPCRRRAQTTASCGRSKALVVSVAAKGPLPAGQVSDEKTSMCDTTADASKVPKDGIETGDFWLFSGTKARPRRVPQPGGIPARRPGGARCIGGVSSSQALARNRRTCCLGTDGQSNWAKVAPWSREGDPQAAHTARGRVPRGAGADRPVVAMKAL